MKRICIGLLTALGCIAVATALIVRPFSKKSIQSYVLRNQDELTNYARKVIEEHPMGPLELSLIHISEPTRRFILSRMPSSA